MTEVEQSQICDRKAIASKQNDIVVGSHKGFDRTTSIEDAHSWETDAGFRRRSQGKEIDQFIDVDLAVLI